MGAVVHEEQDGTLVAEIGDDWHLTIRRRKAANRKGAACEVVVLECTGAHAFSAFSLVLGKHFEPGLDASAWLSRHGIGFIGEGGGGVEKVGLVDGVGVVFRSSTGGIIVPSGSGDRRVLLNALRGMFADGGFSGLDAFTAWLTEQGVAWRPEAAT